MPRVSRWLWQGITPPSPPKSHATRRISLSTLPSPASHFTRPPKGHATTTAAPRVTHTLKRSPEPANTRHNHRAPDATSTVNAYRTRYHYHPLHHLHHLHSLTPSPFLLSHIPSLAPTRRLRGLSSLPRRPRRCHGHRPKARLHPVEPLVRPPRPLLEGGGPAAAALPRLIQLGRQPRRPLVLAVRAALQGGGGGGRGGGAGDDVLLQGRRYRRALAGRGQEGGGRGFDRGQIGAIGLGLQGGLKG